MQEGKENRGNSRRLTEGNACKHGSEGARGGISEKGSALQTIDFEHGWPGSTQFQKNNVKLQGLGFFARLQLVYFKKEKARWFV